MGHGDFYNRSTPTLVDYFGFEEDAPISIVLVATGGDGTGSHTTAVTDDGRVFSWGLGPAIGCGVVKNKNLPVHINEGLPNPKTDKIVKVSAGGGFTVALTAKFVCSILTLFSFYKFCENIQYNLVLNIQSTEIINTTFSFFPLIPLSWFSYCRFQY